MALLLMTLAAPLSARGDSAPDAGRPFVPTSISPPVYSIRPPTDTNGQRHYLVASDGTKLFMETWLPGSKDGNVAPARVPMILVASPYLDKGIIGAASRTAFETMVPRGYAWTTLHVRGTGLSGGCLQLGGLQEIDDISRAIEYVGRHAPWTDGAVGMYGFSYFGGNVLAVAGRGDPERTQYLKAIFVGAPTVSWYDLWNFDGVPTFTNGRGAAAEESAFAPTNSPEAQSHVPERIGCFPDVVRAANDPSGDFHPYVAERDQRVGVRNIRAATFIWQGHLDDAIGVRSTSMAGFFHRLPPATPKAGMFGVLGHAVPDGSYDENPVRPEWYRADFAEMVAAWFHRYLKGLPTRVERWPVVQVQGTDGQWRAEPDWPSTGGPVGHLALGSDGRLGVGSPTGRDTYTESIPFHKNSPVQAPASTVMFQTAPLPERMEMTGQPVLDLWVQLDRPDAHLSAEIETFDAAGEPIPGGASVGFRSMRHLDPLVDGRFVQAQGRPAPVGVPVRVMLRFLPTDLVIPKGGTLRVTIAGSREAAPGLERYVEHRVQLFENPAQLSFSFTAVTVLHDCDHVSALRFLMPRTNPDLLNVREKDEPAPQPLADNRPFVAPVSDAGGLATAPVCGQAPIRLENFGPEIPYDPPE